jgi:hypothetical protein
MRQASKDDYAEAARVKLERDTAKETAHCTLRYLCDEWSSMYNTSMDLSEWRIFSTETPGQHNSKFCLSSIFIELIGTNVLLHLF